MQKRVLFSFFYLGVITLVLNSCVEPFELEEPINFESALVVEATITNELKQHEVKLTRTFEFGADGALAETNADVSVEDNAGNTFIFSETEPGIYVSNQTFQAQAGLEYQLDVRTSDGRQYSSSNTVLTQNTPIGSVTPTRLFNDANQEGVAILVDTFDPTNSSNFYRYEYEETFMIIAPLWVDQDLIAPLEMGLDDCTVEVVRADNGGQVCYGSEESNTIILANTTGLEEDRVSDFTVRFINRDNFIITFRYSILVRQFVQSAQANTFFETLNNLSGSDNLFSQIQPGLLVGNVFSEDDENEIVLGYFDVASVSEERIFFGFDDLFPGEELPPFVDDCTMIAPNLTDDFGICILSTLVSAGSVEYFDENIEPSELNSGPFLVVPRVCGDCTALGSEEVPDFWIE